MTVMVIEGRRSTAIARASAHAPFLREAIAAFPAIVELFENAGADAAVNLALAADADDVGARLRRQRHGLALAVALGDLAGELPLEQVTAILSDFADMAIGQALAEAIRERVPDVPGNGVAVIALGKLGSGELNYSSDVDLILLFDPATVPRRAREEVGEAAVRIGRRFVELLQQRTADGYVARVDLRLRPSPEVTPIILPVEAAISHYESSALPWERAAFIRARAAAGDIALGTRFLTAIEPFIWRRAVDFGAIEEIRHISGRVRDHYAQGQAFAPGYDLKRGRGGIREAEFYTQVQQLIHGGREQGLRVPATLDALTALAESGRIAEEEARGLSDAYRRLRTIEHRAQMIDDQQTHRLPAERPALDAIAALDGLADGDALLDDLRPHVEYVGARFDSLGSERGAALSNDPDILRGQLADLGFGPDDPVFQRVGEWRSGRARSLRSPAARTAFEAMLPGLLAAFAAGPDPGHALNRFSDIVEKLSSGVNFFRLIEAQPRIASLLALILAHAPVLAEQLARRPELFDGLIDESSFDPPPAAADFAKVLGEAMAGLTYDRALDRARRLINERRFALGVQLVSRRADALAVARGYARVAEGAIVALTNLARSAFEQAHGRVTGAELVILGLGRLGGGALTHASDLDLIYLFAGEELGPSDGEKSLGPADYFNRLASRVTAALSVATAAGPLYDVDTRLRPQGAKGMLAVSLDSFAAYQRDEAWTWEHMALLRARPVYGPEAARTTLRDLRDEILARPNDPAKIVADARSMRDEMARHKPAAGPLDIKLGPGGLVDLEFAIHLLQLIHRAGIDPRLDSALDGLIAAGLIDPDIAPAQQLLTRMLVTMRLVAPEGGEPEPESRALVAAACEMPDWDALLAAHAAARHSVAQLWTRVSGGT